MPRALVSNTSSFSAVAARAFEYEISLSPNAISISGSPASALATRTCSPAAPRPMPVRYDSHATKLVWPSSCHPPASSNSRSSTIN